MVLRIVTARSDLRIGTSVKILNPSVLYNMIIFNNLAPISNVALIVVLIVY